MMKGENSFRAAIVKFHLHYTTSKHLVPSGKRKSTAQMDCRLRTVNKLTFSGPPRPAGTPPKEGNHSPPLEGYPKSGAVSQKTVNL